MRIKRTPLRFLYEGRIVGFLKSLRNKRVLEVGGATNSLKEHCEASNVFVRTDIQAGLGVDRVEDVTRMSFGDASFDVVLLSNVLEHVFEHRKAVDECYRVLSPGGTLVLVVPFLYPLHDVPGDYWRFTEFTLERLLERFSRRELFVAGWRRFPFAYTVFATK